MKLSTILNFRKTPPDKQLKSAGQGWKWWLTIVLFLATVLTYLDRQTVSLCSPMICKEFNLSNEQYGTLIAAFRWTYAITHVPAGFIADHFSIRMTYALAVGLWSLAGAAGAFVLRFGQLIFTRAALGVGEGFNWPCAGRIVANILPPTDRGLASGIFNSGAAVGSLIAPLIITPIAIAYGWRWAFFILGASGSIWIFLWLYSTRKNSAAYEAVNLGRNHSDHSPQKKKEKITLHSLKAILLHPAFLMLLVIAVTVNPCWYFLNEWIPKYMHDQRHLGYLSAGLVTVPIFLGADIGNLLSGGLIKFFTMRGWSVRKARGIILSLTTLLILPVTLVSRTENVYLSVILMGLAGLGITSIVANYTACQQDFSFAHVGIVAGINGMTSNVCAALVNPLIGKYIDRSGNYTLVFIFLAVLPVISLGAIVLFDAIMDKSKNSSCPS